MPKMTLLAMTQNILSAMDADEVNSIGDTVESDQVSLEVKNAYYNNFTNFGLAANRQLVQFDGLASVNDHPNVLKVTDDVDNFEFIKYNINTVADPTYVDMCYLEPKEFLDHVLQSSTDGTRITVKDIQTDLPYSIRSDQDPRYWTTFDNEHIVFDSINRALDDTMQESKVMSYAEVIPGFTMADAFIPVLEDKFFPLLLAEAKAAAFVNYKGVSNAKVETVARRQRVWVNANNPRRYNENKKSKVNFGRS